MYVPAPTCWRLPIAAGMLLATASVLSAGVAPPKGSHPMPAPRVLLLDASRLAGLRRRALAGDAALSPAIAKLRRDADHAMDAGPFSVTDKKSPPASGELHDYTSIGPYWWPNPKSPDGKPYIRRDGEVNPERSKLGDASRWGALHRSAVTLATAWYFTGHQPYGDRAARLLRTWFVDPATRMNPNLQYAQAIPGRCEGRGIGIVDFGSLPGLLDAIGMLADAPAWTAADQQQMKAWVEAYVKWLQTSRYGHDESRTRNNHATQYDAQVAACHLFLGANEEARKVLAAVGERRIASQVEPDGRQPLELARTKSWDYSCANLRNLVNLAQLAEHVDVDLWNFHTADGRGIRQALDFLLPFAAGGAKWPHRQITSFKPDRLFRPLRTAADRFPAPRYLNAAAALSGSAPDARETLLYGPLPAVTP